MPIFLISFNECGYDQYDGFVVRAQDAEQAVNILRPHNPDPRAASDTIEWDGGYTVEEIPLDGQQEIILSSFRAG